MSDYSPIDPLLDKLLVYGSLLKSSDYQIVNVHPLADESELLKRLGIGQKDCFLCDLYWLFKNEIFFVSINYSSEKNFVGFHRKDDVEFPWNFNVFTKANPVTSSVVDRALDALSLWLRDNMHLLVKSKWDERTVRIIEKDIC